MNQNKLIGRVLSVDNFRVYIKIDEELLGAYKNGAYDIYEIARINSYLIIPVGSDRVVAIITRITMKEEFEFDKKSTNITLPTSSRYISATMLGTIEQKGNKENFIQGVYNFPALDNPVWYVTEKDLKHIFDDKQDNINYNKDYFLPIGTSPAFTNYKVKICPDQFFVKHAAILGNTGSGKSCTLTSILRNIFKFNYQNRFLKNAHFVIFDTNGEYKNAFIPENKDNINDENLKQLEQINAYYYGGDENVKVPYWFMNWDNFNNLLKPGEGTQAPILKNAIGLSKNYRENEDKCTIPRQLQREIVKILTFDFDEIKKRTGSSNYSNWVWKNENEIYLIGQVITKYHCEIGNGIIELANEKNFNNATTQEPIIDKLRSDFDNYTKESLRFQITSEENIDLPTWFSYYELCTKFIDSAINMDSYNSSRVNEYLSTLRLRMNSFLNDKRIAIPLMLKDDNQNNKNILPIFISFILGDFNKYFLIEKKDKNKNFLDKYNDSLNYTNNETSQITIIDVSQLAFEVLETIASLLGRMLIEFVSHFLPEERGKYPIVIVLEEAQNYISENNSSVAKAVFERIAREGRKYGISLVVCSQRPSELSKTVLSQCNSFIIHRLQNPDDQKYISSLISSANADILDQLSIIPQQHAIITGDCVRTPIQVRIDDVFPTPNSQNPEFINRWLEDNYQIPYIDTCNRWLEIKNPPHDQ